MSSTENRVVIIDDDRDFSRSLVELLEIEGYQAIAYRDGNLALNKIGPEFDGVVLLDIRMPTISGEDVLKRLLEQDRSLPVIQITGHGDIPMAVRALKQGAYGFFTKPLEIDELFRDINNALALRHTEIERRRLQHQLEMRDDVAATINGGSPEIESVRQQIVKIGAADVDVLLRGETGTGKEVVARALVQMSARREAPFVAINCGHVSHQQATEELFGVETLLPNGDTNVRQGHFERANGGTLLLDEIESMPIDMQARLLRVLQERAFERINGEVLIPLDIRIIATTKVNLDGAVADGAFREDLYYRLSGVELPIPPLRERGIDTVLLFDRFLSEYGSDAEIPPGLMSDLLSHDWPGNVRELRNAASRYASGLSVFALNDAQRKNSLAARVAGFEKDLIEAALAHNAGSIKRTMLDLDVPRKTLYDKITKHGIEKKDFNPKDY